MKKNLITTFFAFILLFIGFESAAQAPHLEADSITLQCGQSGAVQVPIRVSNFTDIGSFQFTLKWNPQYLTYNYTSVFGPEFNGLSNTFISFDTSASNINQGILTFSWLRFGGHSVPSNLAEVFSVHFDYNGNGPTSVSFINVPSVVEFADPTGTKIPFTVENGFVGAIDMDAPMIACPANVSVTSAMGPTTVPSSIAPTSITDNCGIQSTGYTLSGTTSGSFPTTANASGQVFQPGSTTVTYTTTDFGGNTATCSFTVGVPIVDDTLTVFTQIASAVNCGMPFYIDVKATNADTLGSLQFSLDWLSSVLRFDSVGLIHPSFSTSSFLGFNTDNAQLSPNAQLAMSWVSFLPEGVSLPAGTTLFRIYYTVVGSANAATGLTFTDTPIVKEAYTNKTVPASKIGARYLNSSVTITDTQNPTISCPTSVNVQPDPASVNANVTGLNPTVADNCGVDNFAHSILYNGQTTTGAFSANGVYGPGVSTVTYVATDDAGNTASCTFTVTVAKIDAAEFNIDTLILGCLFTDTAEICVRVKNFEPVAGVQFALRFDETALEYAGYSNVNTAIGNGFFFVSKTAANEVRVVGSNSNGWPDLVDDTPFMCFKFKILKKAATAVQIFDSPNYVFQVTNSDADVIAGTFSAGMISTADLEAPTFSNCPSDTLTFDAPMGCSRVVDWQPIVATDDCGALAGSTMTHTATGGTFGVGVTPVVFTAVDSAGHTADCSFYVRIKDITPPTFVDCPMDLTVDLNGSCTAAGNWTDPTAADDCALMAGQPTNNTIEPDSLLPVGVYNVRYEALDISGNGHTCAFTFTVRDITNPVLTNCPSDTTVILSGTTCSVVVDWTAPTVTDECLPANGGLSVDLASGTDLVGGDYPVTYTATDSAGNTASCTFMVSVKDTIAPILSACPSNMTLYTNVANCSAMGNWTAPTLTDACLPANGGLTSNIQPDSALAVGNYTVTYTGLDQSANMAACSFTIEVLDTIAPILSACPSDMTLYVDGTCTAMGNWTAPTLMDACVPINGGVTSNIQADSALMLGNHTVTYTGTDDSGNTATCTFMVEVLDTIAPVFTSCPMSVTSNLQMFPYNYVPPTATDNCGMPTIMASHPSGFVFENDTTVIIIATDASGNQDSCVFTVDVSECGLMTPTVTCPPNMAIEGVCDTSIVFAPPSISGFCSTDTTFIVMPFGNGMPLSVGDYTITYEVNTPLGEQALCSFNVTVDETIPPVIDCPTAVLLDVAGNVLSDLSGFIASATPDAACANLTINYTIPTASDNCAGMSTVTLSGPASGSSFEIGTSTVTFNATDAANNAAASCAVNITVQALPEITISTANLGICPGSTASLIAPSIPNATYTWSGPGGNFTNNDTITISPFGPTNVGAYDLEIDANGCLLMANEAVNLALITMPTAVDDLISVVENEAIDTINVLSNDNNVPNQYSVAMLNPANGVSQVNEGIFSFTGTDIPGDIFYNYLLCSTVCPTLCDTGFVTISVKNTRCDFFPNVISPNNDGINDEFLIPCLEFGDYPNNSLIIYSQWGDRVFEAAPYEWNKATAFKGLKDGSTDKILPDGVYYYIFRTASGDAPYKGFIQLHR